MVEDDVGLYVALFAAQFAPSWSVLLKSDMVDVGGTSVNVSICQSSGGGT
jgi:hypothetical protein